MRAAQIEVVGNHKVAGVEDVIDADFVENQ